MDHARWDRLWEIFHNAASLKGERRDAYLDQQCGDDAGLRAEIDELLTGLKGAGDFLEKAVTLPETLDDGPELDDDLAGGRIGAYRLRDVIGKGGMGIVYDAEQESPVQRRVALKLIKLGMDTREVIARFENERQALALMSHPNIANVLDAGVTEDGRPYFVMEYVAGIPITEYCDRHRLPVAERLELFIDLCHAIEHAHQKGIIHRDIKPSNVLVAMQDGKPAPKVIDFGVAKALNQRLTERTLYTALGRFIGTPEYMSPEQAESSGLDVDTRTDIYSLGVLLYKLLCGSLPHESDELTAGDYATVRKTLRIREPLKPSDHISDESTTPDQRRSDAGALRRQLRGDLDWVVMCALDKDRTRRYQTASAFAADVRRFLEDEPVVAGPPSTSYRVKKFVQRHKLGVAMSVAAVALLAAFTAAMTVQSVRLKHALEAADAESERARQESLRARQVSEFLVELFEQTDPAQARGREVTVREVLNQGARQLTDDLPEQPLLKAALRETIGQVYLALGSYPQSLENLQDALALRRQELGDRHPDVARALSQIGRVEAHRGNYNTASGLYEEALALQEAAYPDGHEELATTLNEFGFLLMLQGRYDEALELQRRGLAMRETLLGESHEDVGLSYNDLAITYRRMNEYETAERYYRRALEIWRAVYGEGHPQVATVLNNLGVLLHVSGRFEPAQIAFDEALDIRRRQLGEEHYYTGLTTNNLAGVYIEKGDHAHAEALYRRALAVYTSALGEDNPETMSALSNVARALYEQGRYADAEAMLRQALAGRLRMLDADNPQIATAKVWLARTIVEKGDVDEAGTLAREALQAFRESLPPDHWRLAFAESTLARVLMAKGLYEEAEMLLGPAIEALSEKRGARAQITLRSQEYLASVYEATGRESLAEGIRREIQAP